MKSNNVLVKKILIVFVYVFCCFQSAYADDTEIFFAPEIESRKIKPNLMFIIDTSGSMLWNVDDDWNYTDFPDSRMGVVQGVMNELLLDLDFINVGLMRFGDQGPGAAVLVPIKDIDAEAVEPSVFGRLNATADDGYEESGSVYLTNSETKLNSDSKTTALRFAGLNIPQGATIKSAFISFSAKNDNNSSTNTYRIYAEKSDSAASLETSSNNISDRTATDATVDWTQTSWRQNRVYSTDDLKTIVQEVVDQSGWCGGQNMLFMIDRISGSGDKKAYSADGIYAIDGSTTGNVRLFPEIRIEYESDLPATANGCFSKKVRTQLKDNLHDFELATNTTNNALDFYETAASTDQQIGLAFSEVDVPKDSKILDAFITFTPYEAQSGTGQTEIFMVNDGVPATDDSVFSLGAGLIAGPTWNIPAFELGELYSTNSVATLVETVVARADWQSDNTMVFVLKGISGAHRAFSFDGSQNNAATLTIEYQDTYEKGKFTQRDSITNAMNNLIAEGSTPISDTLAEAGKYFKGESVTYGDVRDGTPTNRVSHSSSYTGGSKTLPSGCKAENLNDYACRNESISGSATYIQPVLESCQTNHIVYLTDGDSTRNSASTIYNDWTGETCDPSNAKSAECAIGIAGHLFSTDLSNTILNKQNVKTHMIGFGTSADPVLMKNMAEAGHGHHYSAADKNELVGVLRAVTESIEAINTTFVTTGVTVNQANRLTHKDELYFSLFNPVSEASWPGNVKRYRLLNGEIVDKNNNVAVDVLTSEFIETAQSFWSSGVDGKVVADGGVASKMTRPRTLYSNLDGKVLTDVDGINLVNRDNITLSMLGLSALEDDKRKKTIDWALGYDINDDDYSIGNRDNAAAHQEMSDPLHSQPTIVTYAGGRSLVYVGTNDGMLHAFDADESKGTEAWAFIPKELLRILPGLADNTTNEHIYGLDGSITVYMDDPNNNGVVDSEETALLYVGMRRGGSSYYVLDISDPVAPELKFVISSTAVTGSEVVSTGYGRLGQTWSKPVIGKMDIDATGLNADKLVMIFGGGYDTVQDTKAGASEPDNVGNIIYIADAYDGKMLWSSDEAKSIPLPDLSNGNAASAGDLDSMNGVPAPVTAFDLDGDGFLDHFYAADTKAQIFRFDVDKTSSKILGGRVAHLQDSGGAANNRRFYYQVDAALISLIDNSFISLSIGSGLRAGPLDATVNDIFFMVKDKGVLMPTSEFDMDVSFADLTDVTHLIGDTDGDGTSDAQAAIEIDGNHGWYIDFDLSGEKVIEKSITFNNAVIFTTYIPQIDGVESCLGAAGGSRIYGMRIVDGNPFVDTKVDLAESDRFQTLIAAGIAPAPQVLLGSDDEGHVQVKLCVSTQCNLDDFLPDTTKGVVGYKWQQQQ